MEKILLLTILFLSVTKGYSQFNETIRTGRPGQSIGAFTVGQRVLQIQSGIDYYSHKNPSSSLDLTGVLSNTVLRFGLTEPFEISALIDYRAETYREQGEVNRLSGLSALDLGMRYHIYTGKGLIPSIGFQLRFRVPRLGNEYEIDQWAPRFILVTSQKLSDKMSLITNWGAAWNGNTSEPTGAYSINLSYSLTDKFGVFIENYGTLFKSDFDTYIDAGFAYLVTNNFQLDLYTGYGSNEGVKDFFISIGISWRTGHNN